MLLKPYIEYEDNVIVWIYYKEWYWPETSSLSNLLKYCDGNLHFYGCYVKTVGHVILVIYPEQLSICSLSSDSTLADLQQWRVEDNKVIV